MRSGRKNACGAGRTKEWNDKGRQKWRDASLTNKAPYIFRGSRHLFHRAGLSDPAAGAVEWRKPRRDKYPSAGDRCPDVRKPDRQPRSGNPQDDKPGAIERCGFFSGRSAAMGAWTHDQYRSGSRWPQGRQPDMGRSVQYLLVDRPGKPDRRRDHDADPPLRRPASAWGLSTIR